MSRLQTVRERELVDTEQQPEPQQAQEHAVATKMLVMALSALGQRFVVALASLFTLITAASVFFLWYIALEKMDATRIVGLSIYALFILAINIYGRRK